MSGRGNREGVYIVGDGNETGSFPFRAEREAVRLDLNWDFRRAGHFSVLKLSAASSGLIVDCVRDSSSEFCSSDSSDILSGSFDITSSLGGDNARVSRNEGEEGDDNDEIVEDDREKFSRGGEKGWQSQASRNPESSVCGDFATHCSDLMAAQHGISLEGHVEKDSARNSTEGLEPVSDSIERGDSDVSDR